MPTLTWMHATRRRWIQAVHLNIRLLILKRQRRPTVYCRMTIPDCIILTCIRPSTGQITCSMTGDTTVAGILISVVVYLMQTIMLHWVTTEKPVWPATSSWRTTILRWSMTVITSPPTWIWSRLPRRRLIWVFPVIWDRDTIRRAAPVRCTQPVWMWIRLFILCCCPTVPCPVSTHSKSSTLTVCWLAEVIMMNFPAS